jgi:FAD:protein FMN transferase
MAIVPDSVRRARPLLGTFVELTVFAGGPEAERAIEAAFAAVAKVHRLMSFHDPRSEVSRLNREAARSAITVDPWTFEVLRTAVDLHDRSDGVFDIAVAPALQRLGLLPYHARPPQLPRTSRRGAIELHAAGAVRFRGPWVRIDLGGIAKGFAVDRAVDVLRRSGMAHGAVNAGGDLRVFGAASHKIDLRHPRNPRVAMATVEMTEGALASSGGTFDPYSSAHAGPARVLDPRTGQCPGNVLGAAVRAPSCMVADALTKVVMIDAESADALLAQFQAEALVMSADRGISVSRGWCSRAA